MNAPTFPRMPALAGLATFAEAQKPGLAVGECVRRLKRWHYAFKRLHEIFLARLTAEPIYELKMAFSLHAHYCAEHVAALRQRVGEMREPPLGLDIVPDENLAIFFDEILAAPTTEDLLAGIYEKAVPALVAALEWHREETNPLADAPSVRVVKFALLEVREMAEYGAMAVAAVGGENVQRPTSNVQRPTPNAQRSGSRCSTIVWRRRAGSTGRARRFPSSSRSGIPRRLSSTTRCRGATRVFPIRTTWA